MYVNVTSFSGWVLNAFRSGPLFLLLFYHPHPHPCPSHPDSAKHSNTYWFPLWDFGRELFLGIPFRCPLWTMTSNGQGNIQISTGFAQNRVFNIRDTGHSLAHNFYWLIADYRIEIKVFKTLQQRGSPQPVASFVLGKTHPSVTGASPSFLNKELCLCLECPSLSLP